MDDLQARCLAIAAAERANQTNLRKKSDNREKYPEFTAWVDDYRKVFGAELVEVRFPDGRTWKARV